MYSFYIVCLMTSIVVSFFKNRRRSLLIGTLIILSVIVIMANAQENLDLYNYGRTYQLFSNTSLKSISKYSLEIGYALIASICSKIGMSFIQFRLLLFSICFLLIIKVLMKYTKNIAYFTTFYMLHSMFMDGEQLRNFIAVSIVIYAIPFLFEKSKNGTKKYVIYVCIASLFHTMSFVYLVFLIINIQKKFLKNILKIIPLCIVVIMVIVSQTNFLSDILILASKLFEETISDKILVYAGTRGRLGFLTPTFIYVSYCLFIKYINKYFINKRADCVFYFCQKIGYINYVGLLFLPFCILSLTFYRWVRNICLLDLIYFACVYDQMTNQLKKIVLLAGTSLLILGWRIFDFSIYFYWEGFYQLYFSK